jgi:hypothetical protein
MFYAHFCFEVNTLRKRENKFFDCANMLSLIEI